MLNWKSIIILGLVIVAVKSLEDKWDNYLKTIKASKEAKYCGDRTRLLPDCKHCIPGLSSVDSISPCTEFIKDSNDIRNEIQKLTIERYGSSMVPSRPFGLYPYLEYKEFLQRQVTFGKMLSERKPRNIMDIGAYYNPINLFFEDETYCPQSVVVIEPILDPLSVMIPCPGDKTAYSHIIVLPITFRYYLQVVNLIPRPDAVVCIGCDSHYGPNRKMLETSFQRPYTLFLEYPSEYVHNAPFRKMLGNGEGEKMTYFSKFTANTTETKYVKRVMKVIEYS